MEQEDKYPDTFVDVGMDDTGLIYHKDAKGEYHNPYGPAVIWSNGRTAYWVNDKKLTEEEFNRLYGKKKS